MPPSHLLPSLLYLHTSTALTQTHADTLVRQQKLEVSRRRGSQGCCGALQSLLRKKAAMWL